MTIVHQEESQEQGKRPFDEIQMTTKTPETAILKRHKQQQQQPRSSDRKLIKYWCQRYNLFSRFDDGIKLDDEAWWSVTPENIAHHIAKRFYNSLGDGHLVIVDGFCGVGGNLIQFALSSPYIRVIGCDINPDRLRMAKHNARIYGVAHQCEFILGDFMAVLRSLQCRSIDAIFLSPPWGGIGYTDVDKYSLSQMTPDGYDIVRQCRQYITNNIAFLMPRNTDVDEVRDMLLTRDHPELECEQNMVGKKIKTITMYFGSLVDQSVDMAPSSPPLSVLTGTSISGEEDDFRSQQLEGDESI